LFLARGAKAQVYLTSESLASSAIVMVFTGNSTWSGGAVGLQGPLSINNGGGDATAANVAMAFDLGPIADSLNATYGAGNWWVTNVTLTLSYTTYANNSRFGEGAGSFDIYWVGTNGWITGTEAPIYTTNADDLLAWAGSDSLLASEYYDWAGDTNDPAGTGTVKNGSALAYDLGTDPNMEADFGSASAAGNPYLSFYLMETSDTMGMTIFNYGGTPPELSFDVVLSSSGTPPMISAQSSNQVVVAGESASFNVAQTGALGQQWCFNGTPIGEATNLSLNFPLTSTNDAGDYTLVLTNYFGNTTSAVIALTVVLPPTVAAQSARQVIGAGGTLDLFVQADGTEPQVYQWFKDGRRLAGASSSILTLPSATVANAGVYYAVVTNAYRMRMSEPIPVAVGGSGLLAWGRNNYGQLGDGSSATRTLPELVSTNAVQAAAGGTFSLFIKSDGTLWAAGYNYYGQLGDGTSTTRTTPECVGTNVISVAAGYQHALFVTTNGLLYAMGYNSRGQLGNGTTASTNIPVCVGSNVTAVAAGWYHSLFIEGDGTLWAMGRNFYGQLGIGTFVDTNVPVWVASNVVFAAAGSDHSLYVTKDGTLWAMGDNTYGQLGVTNVTESDSPLAVASNVVMAVAGGNFSLFVDTHGVLWGMGDNTYGQLGLGTITGTNQPTAIASNVLAVAAGYEHALFQTTNGVLYGMGLDTYGQLGNAGTLSTNLPTPVPGMALGNVVSGGYAYHTLAVGLPQTPVITKAAWQAGNVYGLTVSAFPSNTYWVEAITNLAAGKWQAVSTNTAGANGTWQWQDLQAGKYPQRFYRIDQP
jgi:alpha-tubulin suppressor-like RCC1 family protein